ncbi:hypothetical protein CGERO_06070 [Corynebacterium gerontici]|uniref:Uncharacterized protein n=1 Tax=Corynebacterium gerontici TaxID=2079234 RepID=A0A3G6J0F3_9CORY|nr:hypothetical protein CGERO_06070 [Corynebacterium gerontici]
MAIIVSIKLVQNIGHDSLWTAIVCTYSEIRYLSEEWFATFEHRRVLFGPIFTLEQRPGGIVGPAKPFFQRYIYPYHPLVLQHSAHFRGFYGATTETDYSSRTQSLSNLLRF